MTEDAVVVEELTVAYDGEKAVDGMSFGIRDGELFCLLGPSGCGKTTTLRAIAGLEDPDGGEVYIGGDRVSDEPPHSRDTSVVFQEWALFPRKTVAENVEFALRMDGVSGEKRQREARAVIEKVGLSGREEAYPEELSGGQKQRVALARSLAADPSVLLLDEPLSNLDEGLRREMRMEVLRLHEEFGKTTVHVTHDQEEAFTLADRVGVMRDGRLVQVGEPSEVYSEPETRFVEGFLGETTFVEANVTEGGRVDAPVVGSLTEDVGGVDTDPTEAIEVSLRPEDVSLTRPGTSADGGDVSGRGSVGEVIQRIDHGSTVRYHVGLDGTDGTVLAEYSTRGDPGFEEGDDVAVSLAEDPPVFDGDGRRIG